MSNVLDKIVTTKKQEVAAGKLKHSTADLEQLIQEQSACRGFYSAIKRKIDQGQAAIIAEVKKASPSKGIIRADFKPTEIARSYLDGGAACLSVLTDQDYFKGDDLYLNQVRDAVQLPLLRKDFMIDPWQIYQSRSLGADCILLIAACLSDQQLQEFSSLSQQLGMDVLLEVHDAEEMKRGLRTSAQLIGINNRNLKNFETSLNTSKDLRPMVGDDRIVVSESGIHTSADIKFLQDQGIDTFLIGESFMRHPEPGLQLKNLMSGNV